MIYQELDQELDQFQLGNKIINNLDSHKVNVELDNTELKNSYIGKYDLHKMNLELKGLVLGIEECYHKIKLETN